MRLPILSSPRDDGLVYEGPLSEFIQLLVVQPTPFCNIQCDYCYLPDRDLASRLSRATFQELIKKVFASGLVAGQLSLVWHAGEPLVLPVSYYSDLLEVIEELGLPRSRFRQSIQTNAILLTDAWCDFIRQENINIGVSIDGPAYLHDRHRKDRQGRGTHERVVKGIELLKAHGIDFHVIAVVTSDALDCADEIFDFFLELGVQRLGFNVEELEGEHLRSSLVSRRAEARIRKFWMRLYERQVQSGDAIHVREFVRAYKTIVQGSLTTSELAMHESSQVAPFGIVSVDWQGNLTSFSPELLGLKSVHYGDFTFGNIHDIDLLDLRNSQKFNRVAQQIYEGVKNCERSCQYFSLCGGGAPSNKYFENGSFASTETMYCRTSIQMPIDVVLADLEGRFRADTPSCFNGLTREHKHYSCRSPGSDAKPGSRAARRWGSSHSL